MDNNKKVSFFYNITLRNRLTIAGEGVQVRCLLVSGFTTRLCFIHTYTSSKVILLHRCGSPQAVSVPSRAILSLLVSGCQAGYYVMMRALYLENPSCCPLNKVQNNSHPPALFITLQVGRLWNQARNNIGLT